MKSFFTIVITFILTSISISQTLDFKFCDAKGREYRSTTFSKAISSGDNTGSGESIILLETPSLNDSLYIEQDQILNFLDAETLRLIYITACSTEEYKDGYHTTTETAKALIKPGAGFRIRLLDNKAGVLFESHEVISKEIISQVFLSNQKFYSDFLLGGELKPDNVFSQYEQFDFSGLFSHTENYRIYGIIGVDHQRIKIKLTSIKKNPENPGEYFVSGKSNVSEVICDFIGTWKSYSTGEEKICNWSDFRVPFANQDFDTGAGEFSPGEKYCDQGWRTYQQAWLYGNKEAKEEELKEWWK